jgi:Holliday junction resolvase RusA-like endonuclease
MQVHKLKLPPFNRVSPAANRKPGAKGSEIANGSGIAKGPGIANGQLKIKKGEQVKQVKKVKQAPLQKLTKLPFQDDGSVVVTDVTGKNQTFPVQDKVYSLNWNERPHAQGQRGINKVSGRFFNGSAAIQKRLVRQLKKAMTPLDVVPSTTAIQVQVFFYFKIPNNNPGKMIKVRAYYTKIPDIDNLQKFVFDALKGLFYVDDSQIVYVEACKQYGTHDHTEIMIASWPKK